MDKIHLIKKDLRKQVFFVGSTLAYRLAAY
jgi:hypothetical protein